eukprot:gene9341-2119_t
MPSRPRRALAAPPCDGETWDFLLSISDFPTFKELMLRNHHSRCTGRRRALRAAPRGAPPGESADILPTFCHAGGRELLTP